MPFHDCPRFKHCSANVCPLDPRMAERETLAGEDTCTMEKTVRARIAAAHPELPWGGLWPREQEQRRRWDALPPAEQEARRARMAAVRESSPRGRRKLATPTGA